MVDPTIVPADTVELTVPTRVEFATTLRVLVASLGADADFSIDEIDDLRLAVDEVFTSLAEADPDGRCTASMRSAGGTIWVTMSRHGADVEPLVLDPLATTILASVVDEVTYDADRIVLVKRSAESSANTT